MLGQSKANIRRMLSQLHVEGKARYRGRGRYEIHTDPEEIIQSSTRFYENRIIPRYTYVVVYFVSPPLHGVYTYRQLREITHQTNANINRMLSQFYAENKLTIVRRGVYEIDADSEKIIQSSRRIRLGKIVPKYIKRSTPRQLQNCIANLKMGLPCRRALEDQIRRLYPEYFDETGRLLPYNCITFCLFKTFITWVDSISIDHSSPIEGSVNVEANIYLKDQIEAEQMEDKILQDLASKVVDKITQDVASFKYTRKVRYLTLDLISYCSSSANIPSPSGVDGVPMCPQYMDTRTPFELTACHEQGMCYPLPEEPYKFNYACIRYFFTCAAENCQNPDEVECYPIT